ncbi:Dipeptide transport system permease protein DppC [uncultured bacterium]|nr:Dipeptide transport system permease protein DppC [uncultured bacterium]
MKLAAYYWERIKSHMTAMIGLAFIIFLILTAAIGPFFTVSPTNVNFSEKNLPPVGFSTEQSGFSAKAGGLILTNMQGTWKHPLGTDSMGRDLLSQLISGARVSLLVGLLATGLAIVIGAIIGVSSAYFGGIADSILMRFTDIMMTFPFLLLLILIVYMFGASLTLIILAIGLTGWTGTARLVRSETLSLRTRDFVIASKALGASDLRIIFYHLLPNTISSIIVLATLSIPGAILAEAALSFIGLGDPQVASWGNILNAGQNDLQAAWWIAVEPGIMLFLTVISFNFLGEGLRDAFDPKGE